MFDDPVSQMYEAKAELIETRKELERIRVEYELLKNEAAVDNLDKICGLQFKVDIISDCLEAVQENVKALSIRVSNNEEGLFQVMAGSDAELNTISNSLEIIQKELAVLSARDKETLLLLGGWDQCGHYMTNLLILQNNGDSWKKLALQLPYQMTGHGVQFLNNYLYVFGGQNIDDEEVSDVTYKLSKRLKWEKVADMNEKRCEVSNSNVILNGRIWVCGGWNEGTLNSVEMYNPVTNKWKYMGRMNECRMNAAAAVIYEKIFCCGGGFSSSVEFYDPSSDVWTLIAHMPSPCTRHGAVAMDGNLIVIGGETDHQDYMSNIWILDTTDKTAKWIEKPRMCLPRSDCSIAKIEGKIFVCGGYSKIDFKGKIFDDVEIFNGEMWRNGPKLPTPLIYAAATVISMDYAKYLMLFC